MLVTALLIILCVGMVLIAHEVDKQKKQLKEKLNVDTASVLDKRIISLFKLNKALVNKLNLIVDLQYDSNGESVYVLKQRRAASVVALKAAKEDK